MIFLQPSTEKSDIRAYQSGAAGVKMSIEVSQAWC